MKNALALVALFSVQVACAQDIQVKVNGAPVQFTDVRPTMMGNHVMVPLRGVFEKMGATVRWDPANQSVIARGNSHDITLRVGQRLANIDGRGYQLETPATMVQDRVMVPLRFVSESLGGVVDWNATEQLVSITTQITESEPTINSTTATLESGTVIPVKMNTNLTSNNSVVGDKFDATVSTRDSATYVGLPVGTLIEGHVDAARAKTSEAPGVLSLAFDRVRLPSGRTYSISGALIGTDDKSVDNRDGRLVAKDTAAKDNNIKFVGLGAGAGALLSVITKGNFINDTVIGAALGYLFGQTQKDKSQYNDVNLQSGTEFGVRLTKDFSFRPQLTK